MLLLVLAMSRPQRQGPGLLELCRYAEPPAVRVVRPMEPREIPRLAMTRDGRLLSRVAAPTG